MGKTNQYDLILITALGVAFGLAFIAELIGISVATGALLVCLWLNPRSILLPR
jgi:Kef-type K+ transport system membrane component KefB